MTVTFRKFISLYARLCKFHNLVIFAILILLSCSNNEQAGIHIVWLNNKAVGISLPASLFSELQKDTLEKFLKIHLHHNNNSTAVLGDVKLENNIVFEPLLPFTRGLSYEIFFRDKKIGQFSIPPPDSKNVTELTACYPEEDTVPENLLKIYLSFSHPMSEGQSDKYLTIIKNTSDTLHDIFLNLQPELWNENRTVITIWLNPGRIKRNLQPNLVLGNPLKKGGKYHLVVSHLWKDAQGLPLKQDFKKSFIAGSRDSLSPDPDYWTLDLPEKKSKEALAIHLREPLDHFLLSETLFVKDQQNSTVEGKFEIYDKDKNCRFVPATNWVPGTYSVIIESRLEDLAGNNLNRPFDRDIMQNKLPTTNNFYVRRFRIE